MEEHAPNIFWILFENRPVGFIPAVFILTCSLGLLISRIRGCLRSRPTNLGRDLAFLCAGPTTALLYCVLSIANTFESFSSLAVAVSPSETFRYALRIPSAICSLALFSFIIGVLAFTLPQKTAATIASSEAN
ncbi:hypothetical protein [Chthoniobacter flavus]|uniref:hypothetical protein n=1 Tax=Chthoniobacter flavus TaxID=191863 RepID=UPI0010479C9B|nr:hypothetical protein [Chthoniobacter flavus]